MFPDIVRAISKLYRGKRTRDEYPYFKGKVSDLVSKVECDLQGEYVIAYSDGEVQHMIHVYFDQDTFEAEGTPPTTGFNLSSDVYQ